MHKVNFKNKKIAIVGEGIEGKSSARFLRSKDAEVTILDQKQSYEYLNHLDEYDLIVRSPGVKLSDLINTKYTIPQDKIISQTKLFFDLCPCPIIGVTGTKGKGTTSTLIYEMLKKDGKDAYLGGNIGLPPLELIEHLKSSSIIVLELSSFQLEDLYKSPHIAVVLMITPEHLGKDSVGTQNYHETMNDYISAKRNILRFQKEKDFAILNRDYPASSESDLHTKGKVYLASREQEVQRGCFVKEDKVILRDNGEDIFIVETNELKLRGRHNFENACSAVLAAYLAGVSLEAIRAVLREFEGLEHRLELVGAVNGVEYFNDSFSTTPETAIAAIEAFKNPEILILGGSSKQSNFEELGAVIASKDNIKAIIGIGVEWPRIRSKIKDQRSKILMVEGATTMEQIVKAAVKIAVPGDVVLLSPACASFDMFKNYKDRGEQFKEEVKRLKKPQN
jgi:UDP-N-acetylmuramoylalanine--D-glutamate ligase